MKIQKKKFKSYIEEEEKKKADKKELYALKEKTFYKEKLEIMEKNQSLETKYKKVKGETRNWRL